MSTNSNLSTTLLLITAHPSHPLAGHAYRYAKAFLDKQTIYKESSVEENNPQENSKVASKLSLFFYADAAYTANLLRWQVADRSNLTQQWLQLHQQYQMRLPVCVSTALTRGITDEDNSKRHQLPVANVATGFELVGLGELAESLKIADKVIQF